MTAVLPLVLPLSAPMALGTGLAGLHDQGGGVRPPAGHVWLHGKLADGSSVTLAAKLAAASTYLKLSAKA